MRHFSKIISVFLLIGFAASAHAGWQQTFSDDFDGPNLDTSKWSYSNYWAQHVLVDTRETQCYTDDLAAVGSGSLKLTAIDTPPASCIPDAQVPLLYQSGEVTTALSFYQTYGYFEVRAKMPKGQGLWPAFRLDRVGGQMFPRAPEIFVAHTFGSASDVMQEYDDLNPMNDQVTPYVHTQSLAGDISADYHVYGVDWQPGLVIWYIDGVEVSRHADPNIYSQPMYMILNLAVGGTRAGAPDATTAFPATMEVDYARAYARVNDGTPDTLPPGATPPPPVNTDTVAPKVAFLLPFKNMTVKRKTPLVLAALASDNEKVASISITANGVEVCSATKPLEICIWKVPADKTVSSYVLKAIAKDAAGNEAVDTVTVNAK